MLRRGTRQANLKLIGRTDISNELADSFQFSQALVVLCSSEIWEHVRYTTTN